MTTYAEIQARMHAIVSKIICQPGMVLDARPLVDQGADELDRIEIDMMIEEEWGFVIDDGDTEDLATADDFAVFVAGKLSVEVAA